MLLWNIPFYNQSFRFLSQPASDTSVYSAGERCSNLSTSTVLTLISLHFLHLGLKAIVFFSWNKDFEHYRNFFQRYYQVHSNN